MVAVVEAENAALRAEVERLKDALIVGQQTSATTKEG
jgi:hypothetical protein